MSDGWYKAVEPVTPLTQGDVIFDCPLVRWQNAEHRAGTGAQPEDALADWVSAFRRGGHDASL
jgi:hypothetical protein